MHSIFYCSGKKVRVPFSSEVSNYYYILYIYIYDYIDDIHNCYGTRRWHPGMSFAKPRHLIFLREFSPSNWFYETWLNNRKLYMKTNCMKKKNFTINLGFNYQLAIIILMRLNNYLYTIIWLFFFWDIITFKWLVSHLLSIEVSFIKTALAMSTLIQNDIFWYPSHSLKATEAWIIQ